MSGKQDAGKLLNNNPEGAEMESITIKIGGMTCGGCVASVQRVLKKLDGVEKVDVSLDQAQANISYDAARVNEAQLRSAIEDAGFDPR